MEMMGMAAMFGSGTENLSVSDTRSQQHGMSLIEVLMASSLMLVASIGILPLFMTSMQSNVKGYESSQITSHTSSEIEDLLVTPIDNELFSLTDVMGSTPLRTADGGGEERNLGQTFWDEAATAPNPAFARLGDGAWIQDESSAKGTIYWQRKSVIRQYSYADISDGVIDVNNAGQLFTLGHPKLFDRPLTSDAPPSSVQFKEQDVQVESLRAGRAFGVGDLKTSYFRTH